MEMNERQCPENGTLPYFYWVELLWVISSTFCYVQLVACCDIGNCKVFAIKNDVRNKD